MDKPVKTKEIDARLMSLANEVLRKMETPREGTSEVGMLLLLSLAFFEAIESDTPKEWKGTFMFSMPVNARRLH
jgi:hypothetical protein